MKPSISVLALLALLLGGALAAGPREMPPATAAAGAAAADGDSVAHAITILLPELEARLGKLAGVAATQDKVAVLSVARGYQELGLYDQATAWYERLENLEDTDLFADAIFNGRIEMAMRDESGAALAAVIANYSANVAEPDATLLSRAFTAVGRRGNWEEAGRLLEASLALYPDRVPADLLLLKGRVLRRENRLSEAVVHFEALLDAMGVPEAVHPTVLAQRGRFLRAAADCSFLMNDQLRARNFYQRLIEAGDPEQQEWGSFQIAQMDMLANDYALAETDFRRIAADSLGTLAEQWSAALAEHCAAMAAQRATYATLSPRLKAALD
jgi:tetratricopeptide (TPR) repeat protein